MSRRNHDLTRVNIPCPGHILVSLRGGQGIEVPLIGNKLNITSGEKLTI